MSELLKQQFLDSIALGEMQKFQDGVSRVLSDAREGGGASVIANDREPQTGAPPQLRITVMQEAIKALVAAQAEMTAATKGKVNPAFRNKYATLSDVMDACLPALRNHGFALVQPIGRDEFGPFVDTTLAHESGSSFSSRVHLIIGKNDMQGFGSAVTYARRYGLAALASVTDQDDDGNAAVKNRRIEPEKHEPPHDPETGEVEDNGAPMPSGTGLKAFMDIIKEQVGPMATSSQIAHAYAKAVIDRVASYKANKRGEPWLEQFAQTHEPAIAKLQNGLQITVREAFARKRAEINDPGFDPKDFVPMGTDEMDDFQ